MGKDTDVGQHKPGPVPPIFYKWQVVTQPQVRICQDRHRLYQCTMAPARQGTGTRGNCTTTEKLWTWDDDHRYNAWARQQAAISKRCIQINKSNTITNLGGFGLQPVVFSCKSYSTITNVCLSLYISIRKQSKTFIAAYKLQITN